MDRPMMTQGLTVTPAPANCPMAWLVFDGDTQDEPLGPYPVLAIGTVLNTVSYPIYVDSKGASIRADDEYFDSTAAEQWVHPEYSSVFVLLAADGFEDPWERIENVFWSLEGATKVLAWRKARIESLHGDTGASTEAFDTNEADGVG